MAKSNFFKDNVQVGVINKKVSKNGNQYLSVLINGKAYMAFKNNTEDKKGDYIIYGKRDDAQQQQQQQQQSNVSNRASTPKPSTNSNDDLDWDV